MLHIVFSDDVAAEHVPDSPESEATEAQQQEALESDDAEKQPPQVSGSISKVTAPELIRAVYSFTAVSTTLCLNFL